MTGEITLSGLVLPVGGIREKALAARRLGITTFVLPRDNRSDIEELPPELTTHMTFMPVGHARGSRRHRAADAVNSATCSEGSFASSRAAGPGQGLGFERTTSHPTRSVPVTVAFYISGHGFGHAVRQLAIVEALAARRPEARIVVRSSVPEWLVARNTPAAVEYVRGDVDTGAVQRGSLDVDVEATLVDALRFTSTLDARAEEEARWLASIEAALVVVGHPSGRLRGRGARRRARHRDRQLHLGLDLRGIRGGGGARARAGRTSRRRLCAAPSRAGGCRCAAASRPFPDAAICRSSHALARRSREEVRTVSVLPPDTRSRSCRSAASAQPASTSRLPRDCSRASRRSCHDLDEFVRGWPGVHVWTSECSIAAGAALRRSRRRRRCCGQQARLRHHHRLRGQRHGLALHITRDDSVNTKSWCARCPGICTARSSSRPISAQAVGVRA